MQKDKESAKDKLNEKQEQFCLIYVSKEFFANGTEAYAEAYAIDLSLPGKYNQCSVCASKLLTNANILARIDELLDLSGLNDSFVDKEMLFVITQKADLGAKMRGIDSYNKLKGRLTTKLELTGNFDISLKLE